MDKTQTNTPPTSGSKLYIYSFGYAAANLQFGQLELEITPTEQLTQLDGEVTDKTDELEATGVDKDDNTYVEKQKTSNTIKARWWSLNPHKPHPGLIRRGESVLILRMGDTDKFYFIELGSDRTIRRRDILILSVANSPTENEDSSTDKTTYYAEINTVDKHITLMTTKNDGEKYAYCMQLNAKDGNATIADDAGQFFQLVSEEERLILQNNAGSEIKIEKGKGLFKTPEEILIDTKSLKFKAETITSIATTVTSTATTVTYNYNNFTTSGSLYKMNINIDSKGTLTNNNIDVSSTHRHTTTRTGDPTTTPLP